MEQPKTRSEYGSIVHDDEESASNVGSEYYVSLSGSSSKSRSYNKFLHDDMYSMPLKEQASSRNAFSSFTRSVRKSSDVFLRTLGFYKNPVLSSSNASVSSVASTVTTVASSYHDTSKVETSLPTDTAHPYGDVKVAKRNSSYADMRLSMVSNFSAAYNTINISLALTLMKVLHPPTHSSDVSVCSSALIAGMIIGQLGGGLLGDWLGRHMAMAVVMSLQVAAAFWSAWVGLLGVSESFGIYNVLASCRFLLGVGCGGVYPIAATISAESCTTSSENRGKLVALTFSMQGVGYLTMNLVAYALVSVLGEESDLAWRLLLGFGSLPGLALIGIRLYFRRACDNEKVCKDDEVNGDALLKDGLIQHQHEKKQPKRVRLAPTSLLQQIQSEPHLFRKILGTALCWLLFDVLFYGNALFQPVVLSSAFGSAETILTTVRDSTIISIMALPGYFVSVAMLGKQSPKRIQLQGFLVMAVLYAIIGFRFSALSSKRLELLTLYGLTFFFSNYGPNTTTFMLPSITFSRPCRSTLNGICAASGKVGALFGSIVFLPLAQWLGNDKVMLACAVVSLIAAAMTMFLDDTAVSPNGKGVPRISSEAHVLSLASAEDETSTEPIPKMIHVASMATFLDHA